MFQTNDPLVSWKNNGTERVEPAKYNVSFHFTTTAGHTVDTCVCVTLLPYNVDTDCVHTGGVAHYFEDMINPATLVAEYTTGEILCD